jgi:transcriptional regulator with XRE-family HTH domain
MPHRGPPGAPSAAPIRPSPRIEELLGPRIRLLREQAGLTQTELGLLAGGLAPAEISRYETGRRVPGLIALHRLARGLGLPISAILEPQPPVTSPMFRDLDAVLARLRLQAPGVRDRTIRVMNMLIADDAPLIQP